MNLLLHETAIGPIGIAGDHDAVTHVFFATDSHPSESDPTPTPVLTEAARQLDAYLAGNLRRFTLPLAPHGTPYMTRVWDMLRAIPYGETASYRHIAELLGNPGAARAVGLANNKNPIPLFIPCHRVVGANGSLTGYRGGLPLKQRLLDLERGRGLLPARPEAALP